MEKRLPKLVPEGEKVVEKRLGPASIVAASVLFGILVFLLYQIYARLRNDADQAARVALANATAVISRQIDNEIKDAQAVVYAVRGLFYGSIAVEEDEFGHFVDTLEIQRRQPALFAVAYLEAVNILGEERYIVKYDRQLTGVSSIVGYDAASDPTRRETLDRARDSGGPEISKQLVSMALPGKSAFIIVLPIYRNGAVVDSVEARRTNIIGFALAAFVRDEFFGGIFSRVGLPGIAGEIFDGPVAAENLLYDSEPREIRAVVRGDRYYETSSVAVLGGEWNLYVSYHPNGAPIALRFSSPGLILGAGAVTGFLILLVVIIIAVSRTRAYYLAGLMTAEVEKFKLAVENSSSHIIITDTEGKIVFANDAAVRMTGYPREEIIGANPRLWGGQMEKDFYQKMWHTIKDLKQPFHGELTNKKKMGELYTVLLTISPILEDNNLLGFVGQEDDITDRIKAENSLRAQTLVLEEEKSRDEAFLASIGEGLIAIDKNGKVVIFNRKAEQLLGWKAEEALGRHFREVWQIVNDKGVAISPGRRPVELSLLNGRTYSDGDHFYTKKDGSLLRVGVTVAPIIVAGKTVGVVDIFRDITKEKEVDRMKTEFISLASHQLRTPLSAMKWFLEILMTDEVKGLSQNQLEALKNIDESNERMITLVNTLLNVSRLEAGRVLVEPELTDFGQMTREIVARWQRALSEKKQGISVSIPADLPRVMVDAKLTAQVYDNLLSNAIKYSPLGSSILLEVKKEGENIVSKLVDAGYGIPKEEQGRVFGKFYRGSNIVKLETEGTGLGLYLARIIVEQIGGKIWFSSEGENKGTTFWFSIPKSGMKPKEGEVGLEEVRV